MPNDLRQSKEWAEFLASQGWGVEQLTISNQQLTIFIRKIPLIGSIIKIQRPAIIPPVEKIDKIAKKHRAFCVKLEPSTINHKLLTGFSRDPAPSLSTKTVAVNLIPSLKTIFANFPSDGRRTRGSIKEATRSGVRVICVNGNARNFNDASRKFHRLLSQTGKRQRFLAATPGQLKAKVDAFGKNALLFLAYPPNRPIARSPNYPLAGALILTHSKTAYYHHAASTKEGQDLHAPYLLMWEIIKRAKKLGFEKLDLGGIYDSRYHQNTKQWRGFSIFKKKFGDIETEYPMPLVKHYNPALKILSKLGINL